jgi:hypothetical protein
MAYGRPIKGKSRRVPITVHAPLGLLDIIETYVEERDKQEEKAYSRSEFFTEAALIYLRQLGLASEETPEDGERSKNVPKKSEDKSI